MPLCPATSTVLDEQKVGLRAGVAANVSIGALPVPLPAPGLFLDYVSDHVRLAVAANVAFAWKQQPEGAGAPFFQRWTLAPAGCWRALSSRLAFDFCGGLETGAVRAEGFGTDRVHSRWSAWVTPTLGMRLERLSKGSALGLNLDLEVPLVRTEFLLAEESLFRPSPLIVSFGVAGAVTWL